MIVIAKQDNPINRSVGSSSRAEVLARYRRVREIGRQHHSAVMKLLTRDTILSQARRLGLARGKTLVLGNMEELNLVFDLSIYTAPKDRSRAIDRYAKLAQPTLGTDEAIVLEAMRQARFALIACTGRHPVAGLMVQDLIRGIDCRLVDENLERSLPKGAMLATRLYSLDGFIMTAGVAVPLDRDLLEDVIADTPLLNRKGAEEAIADRRFAETIYRLAVESGRMEQISFEDTIAEAG